MSRAPAGGAGAAGAGPASEPRGACGAAGVSQEPQAFQLINALLCSYHNICWTQGPEARQAGKALVSQAQSLGLYGSAGAPRPAPHAAPCRVPA